MTDSRGVSYTDMVLEVQRRKEEAGLDPDVETDAELLRGKKTWSRKQFEKITKLFDQQPSRKQIFTEVQSSTDFKTWTDIDKNGNSISYAKVYNPTILNPNNENWREITQVQRLEVEDPEGTMTEISKHVAQELGRMDSFTLTWTKVRLLPSSIFHQNMKTLSLPRNQLKSLAGIEAAENLANLDVSSNLLAMLPDELGRLKFLECLNISGNGVKELPHTIGSLNRLTTFDCSSNKIKTLPESIGSLKALMDFDVGNNYLTNLPDSIGNLQALIDLRAPSNQLSSLPLSFGQLTNLKSLLLRKNKFDAVPNQLSSLKNLQNLNMKDNCISTMTASIPSLTCLILDGNQFTSIDETILLCTNLQMLWLQRNQIRKVSARINEMKKLRTLHLSGNDWLELPKEIGQLEQLKHLSLKSTGIKSTPSFLANNPNITVELDDLEEEERDTIEDVERRNKRKTSIGLLSRVRSTLFGKDPRDEGNSMRHNNQRHTLVPETLATNSESKSRDYPTVTVHYKDTKRDTLRPNGLKDGDLEMQRLNGLKVAEHMQARKQTRNDGEY